MTDHIQEIATAALLHDIGKFWQRTGLPAPFDKQEREHFGTYAHALWSAHFIERVLQQPAVAGWVRHHHQPDSRESMLISLADWLSSAERQSDEEQERGRPEAASLHPILVGVQRKGFQKDFALPLKRHGDFSDADFMPREGAHASRDEYAELWRGLENEINGIEPLAAPHATWLALMRRYTSRIPAATPTRVGAYVPDISLYEHSRITAALAACFLADDMTEEQARAVKTNLSDAKDASSNETLAEPVARLVCGNLSGIQDFLYAVPRKGAAKTLKARSFLLQMVCESCAIYLCEQAGLPASCVIYNGGGRFYLLFPRNADLEKLTSQLEDHVMGAFMGNLSVLVGAADLAPRDFLGNVFTEKWRAAGEKANERKLQKLSRPSAKDFDSVFGPVDEEVHPVASFAPPGPDNPQSDEDKRLAGFGRDLREARWLVRMKASGSTDPANRFFQALGWEYRPVHDVQQMPGRAEVLEVIQLDGFDPADTRSKLRPRDEAALTYRFLAKAWPKAGDDSENPRGPATFEELAARSRGAKKLGIFRTDVDNLGAVFMKGLDGRATISRTAMLSAALSDFFEGYIDALVQREPYAGKTGIIYTGGDDLFVVGAWDAVTGFALELRNAFTKYAAGNPALTFSGGVVIVEDHLPLRYAADLAHEAEETAKGYERNGTAKNALCLFGTPIGFEEMPRFLAFREQLEMVLTGDEKRKPMPSAFLHRLYEIWELYERERAGIAKRHQVGSVGLDKIRREAQWKRWRWMLTYGLKDFAKKAKDWHKEITEIQERILDGHNPIEDRLGVPLRWTELLLKKEEERS